MTEMDDFTMSNINAPRDVGTMDVPTCTLNYDDDDQSVPQTHRSVWTCLQHSSKRPKVARALLEAARRPTADHAADVYH